MVFGRRYRVTEKIGAGGMADVFKAVDEVLGRTVAVKVLHARYAAEPTFAARFRQEAQAAANLQSPYIVNIYDWGQDGDTYYIVMELVRGTDLKSIIEQKGALDSRRVAEIGAQVCSALIAAHGYDVIHRDIKPHNIMVSPDGSVKVMDFGIARAGNTTMTQTGSVLGTAHYVSPEQAQGRPLTAASDLYSLGVVLYEAATGRLPFDAETPVAVALKQVNEQPRRPRELNPNIDPGLEAVIGRALAKSTAERYESADDMRRDLMRVIQGREVAAAPAGMVTPAAAPAAAAQTAVMPQVGSDPYAGSGQTAARRTPSPAPRRKPVWPWVVLAVLLIGAGLGVAWFMGLLGPQSAAVPDLTGKGMAEAEQVLTDAGFAVGKVSDDFSPDIPKGKIMGQSPVPGAQAEKGSQVKIIVSKGPKLVEVPQIIGLSEADAQAALQQAGLTWTPLPSEANSKVEPGNVFEQNPDPGTQAVIGSTVEYVVSRGPNMVVVPDVKGKSQATAESILKDAKLKVSVKPQFDDTVPAGKVISQNPSKGIEVAEGSTVTIVVSKGPETVPVPDVIGTSQTEATATLEGLGFVVKPLYEAHANNGSVISQDPEPGTKLKRGATVTITIDGNSP